MSAMTRNFKLGLFVIGGAVALVIAAIVLGLHLFAPATTSYHTYFDESVQGLDVGSPVKYRGVRIGSVGKIGIAPDRRHVDVVLDLGDHAKSELDLAHSALRLRAQLVVTGLTGLKYVELDYADPKSPPPKLPFRAPKNYIPSRPSLISNLAADVEMLSQRIPTMADQVDATMKKLNELLDEAHDQQLVARIGATADKIGNASETIGRIASRGERLPEQAAAVLGQARSVLKRVDGKHGLIASAQRATDSVGDVGRSTLSASDELGRTLRELGDAARAVRELAEDLQRQPDILVKGRARSSRR